MLSNLENMLKSPSMMSLFDIKKVKISTKNWESVKVSLLDGFVDAILKNEKAAKEILSDEEIAAIIFSDEEVRDFLVKKLQKEINAILIKDRQTQNFVFTRVGTEIKDALKKHRGILRAFEAIIKRQLS